MAPIAKHVLNAQASRGSRRRGVTLIELLVVISIMLMLAAYALPKLEPMARGRKIREAARSVNVFLNRARSRAIETGRPCGVIFQRVSSDITNPLSNACTMLYQAEVPPPYAGDTGDATMRLHDLSPVTTQPPTNYYPPGTIILKARIDSFCLSDGIVRRGDLIQLNGQGLWYEIIDDDINYGGQFADNLDFPLANDFIGFTTYSYNDYWLTLRSFGTPGQVTPWPNQQTDPWSVPVNTLPPPPPTGTGWSAPVPFKILRKPVRTIAQPLTLPVGTCVDLSASGIDQIQNDMPDDGDDQTFSTGANDVVIMFSPNGSVSRYYWDINGTPPDPADATSPIFLLVGWREQVVTAGDSSSDSSGQKVWELDDIDEESLPNWQVLTNMWLALNPQTGLISVAENAYPDETYDRVEKDGAKSYNWKIPAHNVRADAIIESRRFARQAQSKGGR